MTSRALLPSLSRSGGGAGTRRAPGIDWPFLLPAAAAAAFALGAPVAAAALAAALPTWLALSGWRGARTATAGAPDVDAVLLETLRRAEAEGLTTALLRFRLDPPRSAEAPGPDRLVLAMARARGALRGADALVADGADGFAVVLHPVRRADLDVALRVAGRVQAALREPMRAGTWPATISAHAGLCTAAAVSAGPAADLARRMGDGARTARDRAGRLGAGTTLAWSTGLAGERAGDDGLVQDVARAIRSGAVEAWFQPQVALDTGRVCGMETLARWRHPEHGQIPPPLLLDAAEEAGVAPLLARAMARQAARALVSWDRAGLVVPSVSINLAPAELRDPALADDLVALLAEEGVPRDRMALEILETVVAEPGDGTVVATLRALARHGLRLELDDFGTQAGCIANVTLFGVGRLKIDRSLVAGLALDEGRRRTVRAILSMAEVLGVDVVAEGVETEADANALRGAGCRAGQGFGLCRPAPADEIAAWLRHAPSGARDAAEAPSGQEGGAVQVVDGPHLSGHGPRRDESAAEVKPRPVATDRPSLRRPVAMIGADGPAVGRDAIPRRSRA